MFLVRKSNGGGITLHNLKVYYRAIATKTVQGYTKTGPSGTEDLYTCNYLFFDTVAKYTH